MNPILQSESRSMVELRAGKRRNVQKLDEIKVRMGQSPSYSEVLWQNCELGNRFQKAS